MEVTNQELQDVIKTIAPLNQEAMEKARSRQQSLAKPPGSLGLLEDISIQMAGVTGKVNNHIEKTCVVVMCADNGVVEENVSSAPQSVTLAQTINFTRRLTGVGALSESFGSELLIVDVGINGSIPQNLYTETPFSDTHKIVNRRIAKGTRNLTRENAMTEEQTLRAVEIGLEMAAAVKEKGYDIFGIGEMGIGNTTTSAAVLSALTGESAAKTVGKGGGIVDSSFARKKEIVDEALSRCRGLSPLSVLSRVGGFDLAAMTGAFLGAAVSRLPVVIDGYISAVAALTASRIAPACVSYMFPSHSSYERGYRLAMEGLGLMPYLDLKMRLGEGSGCPLAFKIIEGACGVMNRMATFEEAEINDDYLEEIRRGDCF
ncbi:nicotinate-nucleotide--dimethylbenzimidazole phosphoribosyltransferase [Ihubacter massiliensis]|uniref:Nicotinate-nucleotide--dimethylbenzimidazole phosphoribosyltransferase n=1 Tax=Hominibacterium faecale TaxID=2839743 RepID=A0A9J6QRL2_9FIRM|nr:MULTISPECIES: nicotinate-nucleotide--dimethylbenzimidazole phosphoribosyltransferase [Eubacteriales Family XIII. Incertae Sedis]MCI7304290.1 nicotinate-nucleotide--dimethylbenzimidazole phosphoribosyltransferase [Clostridia bacterium]MCO7122866.1 nicotinate-nucleotide--dimethylbenzimidazole phosphoribosyltransferase [Ihubacter massiliensis]MCU7377139.1 nicotinate-nucleotide--dimethylbenzimidazole phosphoribosyltransferase [Hominibacterium faecale]MDY3010968.1 nicotinate-nucleotide--dimethylb